MTVAMATGRAIDHIVVAVDDLDAAADRYQSLGFTLTPRAAHQDRMGTSNRLAQFAGQSFIELLEVDRPQTLEPHSLSAEPPRFSFGAHNRAFLERRNGTSMLVFASGDAAADRAGFLQRGVTTYAPFDFERDAQLPDGEVVTVAFSLVFTTTPALPDSAFFVCQNRAPEHFWKPDYQRHANGAMALSAVYIVTPEPAVLGEYLCALFGGASAAVDGGVRVACGDQAVYALNPDAVKALAPGSLDGDPAPRIVGIELITNAASASLPPAVPPSDACGLFIRWRAA